VATIGPVRRLVDQAVAELREGPAADSHSRIVRPRKLAIVTLWPRFLFLATRQPAEHKIVSTEHINVTEVTSRMSSAAESNRTTLTAFALTSNSRASQRI